jgi:protein subunit release factor A
MVGTHAHASDVACKVCNICTSSAAILSLNAEDEDMKQMAQEETDKIRKQMQSLEAQLEVLLLPKDPLDERSIMLEVTAAAALTLLCTVS